MAEQVCVLNHIVKKFDNIVVLDDICISLNKGEIHAIIGNNGEGKSTLMQICAGLIPCDSGDIEMFGKVQSNYNQYQAKKMGIYYMFPDSTCISDMSVLENLFIKDFPIRKHSKTLNRKYASEQAVKVMKSLNFNIDLNRNLSTLGTAERRMVQLANILCQDTRILVLDEISLGLNEREMEGFYKELMLLKDQGVSIFWISQDLKKVYEIADRVTLISKGKVSWTLPNTSEYHDEIYKQMGIAIKDKGYPKINTNFNEVAINVVNLSNKSILRDINFSVKAGQIFGVFGVAGSGRTMLARCLFGLDKTMKGEIWLHGKVPRIRNSQDAVQCGLGYMEENVLANLIPEMNAIPNITLANVSGLVTAGVIDYKLEKRSASYFLEKLRIPKEKWNIPVKNLSMGEKRLILFSKWLFSGASIIILDEPTLGLDRASKTLVYSLMSELAAEGISFILISSDISELIGMCDEVIMLNKGQISAVLSRRDLNTANFLSSM